MTTDPRTGLPAELFTTIDHVGIAVPDLDKALAFYAQAFGVHSVREGVYEEQGVRSGEQPPKADGGRGAGGLTGQHPLGLGVGAVLAHQGEHGGQVCGTRGARRDAGPGTGN